MATRCVAALALFGCCCAAQSGAPWSPPQCSVDGDCDQSLGDSEYYRQRVLRSEVRQAPLRASEFCGDGQCQIESCDSDADCTHYTDPGQVCGSTPWGAGTCGTAVEPDGAGSGDGGDLSSQTTGASGLILNNSSGDCSSSAGMSVATDAAECEALANSIGEPFNGNAGPMYGPALYGCMRYQSWGDYDSSQGWVWSQNGEGSGASCSGGPDSGGYECLCVPRPTSGGGNVNVNVTTVDYCDNDTYYDFLIWTAMAGYRHFSTAPKFSCCSCCSVLLLLRAAPAACQVTSATTSTACCRCCCCCCHAPFPPPKLTQPVHC